MTRTLVLALLLASCASTPPVCRSSEDVAKAQQDKLEGIALALGTCVVSAALDRGTTSADTGARTERITDIAALTTCLSAGAYSIVSVYYAPIPRTCPPASRPEAVSETN